MIGMNSSSLTLHSHSYAQVCAIYMVLSDFDLKAVTLVPNKILMSSDTELTQYFIKEWFLTFEDPGFV